MSKPFLAGGPYKNRPGARFGPEARVCPPRLMIAGGSSLSTSKRQNGNEGKNQWEEDSAKCCLYFLQEDGQRHG